MAIILHPSPSCGLHLGLLGHYQGEALGTTPQTYGILEKPTLCAQGSHPDAVQYATAKAIWNKKNA